MPLISTLGAASSRGFGEFNKGEEKLYVEDVFSIRLYSGSSSDQTITNGIDLLNKGGMVWVKNRNNASGSSAYSGSEGQNMLVDTARGMTLASFSRVLVSNLINAQSNFSTGGIGANSNGFTVGYNGFMDLNLSSNTYSSWTFRKAPKFFDVVTYTGNASSRTISHSLGVAPGLIIIKRTDTTSSWAVYHRSISNTEYLALHSTAAVAASSTIWASTTATDAVFSVGNNTIVNASGGSYVAYLFAHDTTADGIVQCGSFTTDGSGNATVNLGYEPQYIITKRTDAGSQWAVFDNMRGMSHTNANYLFPNLSTSEVNSLTAYAIPTATGVEFKTGFWPASSNIIYMAIRRGPMKVPTDATKVFSPVVQTPSGLTTVTSGFVTDTVIQAQRNRSATTSTWVTDRLRGNTPLLRTNATASENTALGTNPVYYNASNANTGFQDDFFVSQLGVSTSSIYWMFRRAPQVYDSVCYSGSGSNTTRSHNLGIAPEMMIVKCRNSGLDWWAYHSALGNTKYMVFNGADAPQTSSTAWNNTTPTASVFSVGTGSQVNASGNTYVAYLFATCAGVSKVGSYTGNGGTQTISCGFSGGARFVMIKNATASNTDKWWIWDTARGMISGNDLRITPSDITAEQNYDDVFTTTGGFQVTAGTSSINNNGGTYIFLAIA